MPDPTHNGRGTEDQIHQGGQRTILREEGDAGKHQNHDGDGLRYRGTRKSTGRTY